MNLQNLRKLSFKSDESINDTDSRFFFLFLEGILNLLYIYTVYVYNENIHINVSLIFIQIYSEIMLLLIIINCNKI